ncbi:MAG: hypothetical protein Q4D61_07230 [Cardiobacteriaceae bacterium]|nr:hypothetical protein [Cardiobacteriaceae bacterium]
MTLTGFLLFGLAVLLILFAAARRAPAANIAADDADIAALIAEHDAQTFASDDERHDAEHRLYHAIRHIEQQRQRAQRMPLLPVILAPLLLFAASWLWYAQLGGNFALHWQQLTDKLAPALTRSQHLGDLPQTLDEQALHTYCQALQSRIERTDREQLQTLGSCYSQYGNHAAALSVYQRLLHLAPDDNRTALQYAQASLFAHPDQPMRADVEAILTRLYRDNPDDTLTGILLATAYTRAGERDKALPVWQQLKNRTAADHPFHDLIKRSEAQLAAQSDDTENPPSEGIRERPATIVIPPARLATLPDSAQLFVMLSGADNPVPLAVQKLDPRERQTVRFTRDHSMSGSPFLDRDDLILRAFISADGSASGEKLGDIRQNFHLDTHPTLEFPAP